jgi:hypothetical protein
MALIDDAYRQAEKEAEHLRQTQNVAMTKEQIENRAVEIRLSRFDRL